MSEQYAWRGRVEDGEDHLTLNAAEDEVVRGAWERAAAKRADFDDMMRGIQEKTAEHGSQLPGDRMGSEGVREIDYSLKGLDSLRRKVASELREDPSLDATEVVANLKDLNRYTLTFESSAYTAGAQAAFQELQQRGFEAIKVQNTWTDPVYKGINSAWEHEESGQRIELQLHTPDSFSVKSDNHRLFELARSGALVEEFGEAEALPYTNAANELMNERYQQCREVDGRKVPIQVPENHQVLAKPFERAKLGPPASEEHKAAVRERAGEPQPTAQQQQGASVTAQAAQQKLSVAQLAEMKGGHTPPIPGQATKGPAQQQQGPQTGKVSNPAAAAAQKRSGRGTAQTKGAGTSQAPNTGKQNVQQARQQNQTKNQNGGRSR
ncbi:hypothetical protein [Streptomyces sp. NPDC005336]|uniref:hypothetical protein n=1 Tax=Streptomyces sp. NPDC005336 TaxID=3157035 RepID=UPI0033B2E1FC